MAIVPFRKLSCALLRVLKDSMVVRRYIDGLLEGKWDCLWETLGSARLFDESVSDGVILQHNVSIGFDSGDA